MLVWEKVTHEGKDHLCVRVMRNEQNFVSLFTAIDPAL